MVNSATDVVLENIEIPVPGANEVLVCSTVVGICGSDMHAAHGRHPFMSLRFRPGHEVVGVASGAGADVDPAWIGARDRGNERPVGSTAWPKATRASGCCRRGRPRRQLWPAWSGHEHEAPENARARG
ncbi:alcohol dehydrogenase catalytic domain-containing protein [Cryobacterium sp. TMT1-2-2]|uniref:alcohol dehydrogenase catalytic domain-containing protein n=1 Tax=Cryobacterium sp. TMT1-2-2 TaxID=1259233 RepID=UPI001F53F590|nr:alcohol dehydrogenase catalytic domain-containing protein [Cryobacterium sp. TMT1-2-2]